MLSSQDELEGLADTRPNLENSATFSFGNGGSKYKLADLRWVLPDRQQDIGDIVRHQTRTLVVVATKMTLTRPWCAVEAPCRHVTVELLDLCLENRLG